MIELLPPSAQHVGLLGPLLGLMLALHLPFVFTVLATSAASLLARRLAPALAGPLLGLVLTGRAVWLWLGVLPLASAALLQAQWAHGSAVPALLAGVLGGSLLAQAGLALHRERGWALPGLLGNGLLGASYAGLALVLVLLGEPERWALWPARLPPVFGLQVLALLGLWSALGLALAGSGLLFVYGAWPERRLAEGDERWPALRRLGWAMAGAGALGAPGLLVVHLFLARPTSLSATSFGLASLLLALLAGIGMLIARQVVAGQQRGAGLAFALALAASAGGAVLPVQQQAVARLDQIAALEQQAQWRRERERLAQASTYPRPVVDLALGARVFATRCAACHAWERPQVGPPLALVLVKYVGQEERLQAFIRSPARVDSAYPPMPSPGLEEGELLSVVRWSLAEHAARSGGAVKAEVDRVPPAVPAGGEPAAVVPAASAPDAVDAVSDVPGRTPGGRP